jgi:phage protein D
MGQTVIGFEVQVGSSTFTHNQSNGLLSVIMEDHVDMASVCSITVSTAENQPTQGYKIGDKVSIKIQKSEELFSGELIAIDHSFQGKGTSSVILKCLDHSHRLARGRQTRFWNDMKDSDVVSEVGAESQLSVEVDATSETHKYILQRNESNLGFLKRLAARNNFQLRVEPGKLLFKKADGSAYTYNLSTDSGLISLNMSYNSSDMVQNVVVRGWDTATKKEIVGKASAGDVQNIGAGEGGPQSASVFGDQTAYITDVPVSTQEMADELAKAEMERIARRFGRGKAVIVGDGHLRAGSTLNIEKLGQGVNGAHYVISSRHVIRPQVGYRTEVTFCSNTMGN